MTPGRARVTEPNKDGDRPITVMVVDDSRTIRSTAETLLGKEGFAVVTAEDGFDALAKIAADRPDIVFVDIMMPRLDGYQTCTLIKGNPQFRSIPVILLSSRDGVFDRARGKLAGSEQYLGKPFSREELVEIVRRHVARAAPG
jgi:twitching motility two-component system response regulator PilG